MSFRPKRNKIGFSVLNSNTQLQPTPTMKLSQKETEKRLRVNLGVVSGEIGEKKTYVPEDEEVPVTVTRMSVKRSKAREASRSSV